MYSPGSPALSSIGDHLSYSSPHHGQHNQLQQQHQQQQNIGQPVTLSHLSTQCLRFKYFTTFLICTTCLALLSASLATHKWIISKPIRILKLNGGQTNLTALMLTALDGQYDTAAPAPSSSDWFWSRARQPNNPTSALLSSLGASNLEHSDTQNGQSSQNNKFQGEIYFGLFKGVKVLNYGFGDRISPISGESF